MMQPLALACSFDQARDVSHHEFGRLVELDHTQVRFKRRERVVRDLRLGLRDHTDQGGLSDIRESDECDVSHQTELHLQPALFTVLALFGEARRPPFIGQELSVTSASAAASDNQPPIAMVDQFSQERSGVQVRDDGAYRHGDLE
jgi:hypothetical protein